MKEKPPRPATLCIVVETNEVSQLLGSRARGYNYTEIKSLLLPTGVLGGSQAVCAFFPRLRDPLSSRAEIQEQAAESECGVSVYCSERQGRCQLYCNKNRRLEVTCTLNSRCEYNSFGMNARGLLREHRGSAKKKKVNST